MKYVLMALQLVPTLIDIIKKLEEIIPKTGMGATKMTMIRKIIETAYPEIMVAWDKIESLINVLVKIFNDNGIFKKNTTDNVTLPNATVKKE